MMMRLANLRRDERGASIIEMALVAPFLASLLVGMVDISRGYSAKLQLEQSAQRAIEHAMQGKKEASLYNTLQSEAASAAGVATSAVTVKYWLECNGVSQYQSQATMQADFEKVCPNGQVYARYIEVTITKNYAPMFSTKFLGSKSDGTFDLVGKAGMRVQ